MKKCILSTCLIFTLILTGPMWTLWAQEPVSTDPDGLAVGGYDPVAYFTEQKAVPGTPGINTEHDGAVYRFSSTANREAFLKNPQAYLPQYGGYCAWAVSRGSSAGIDPEAWTIQDGRLFLNLSRGVHRRFQKDLEENIRKADANWPKVKSRLDKDS